MKMFLLSKLLLLLGFSLMKWTDAQRSDITPRSLTEKNRCKTYTSCSECLQQAGCAWCSKKVSAFSSNRKIIQTSFQQDFSNNGKQSTRCNPIDWYNSNNDHLLEDSCSNFVINSTINTTIEIIKDDELGNQGNGNQLRPQKILVQTGPSRIFLNIL